MSQDLQRSIRVLIALVVPLCIVAAAGPSYVALAALSAPLLLTFSRTMLALVALSTLFVVVLLLFAPIEPAGDIVFLLGSASGVVSARRRNLFDSAIVGWLTDRASRPRVAAGVATIFAIGLIAAAAFDDSPWVSCLILGVGYLLLVRRLRAATPGDAPSCKSLSNALVTLLSVAFSLALLEMGARLFIDIPVPPPPRMSTAELNAATLWAPRASIRTMVSSMVGGGNFIQFQVTQSAQGLRGPDVAPKLDGELRIALLGDSFTYGWGVNDDETMASYLQRLVATQPRPVSVLNLGVFNFSPWQELEFLKQRGLPLQPDIVVLQLYMANDVPDTLIKFGDALPTLSGRSLTELRYWRSRNTLAEQAERSFRTVSKAYNAYREIWPDWYGLNDVLQELRFVSSGRTLRIGTPHSNRYHWLEVRLEDYYPQLERAYAEFQSDVRAIAALCEENGIDFYVYPMPSRTFGETEWEDQFERSRQASGEDVAYEMNKDMRLAHEFIDAEGFKSVPVFETLSNLPDPEALYIPRDGHLTPQGNWTVARAIFDQLVSDGVFESVLGTASLEPGETVAR